MRKQLRKFWVILQYKDGKIEINRDYDDGYIWNSPIYTVLGYFEGSYIDARRYSKTL